MKPAATYIQRPLPVAAIQVPPAGSAPSGYWMASLHSVIGTHKHEFGKRGQLAVLFHVADKSQKGFHIVPVVANPGDWIVAQDGYIHIYTDEQFEGRFTEPGEDHAKLEAERFLHHTTP